MGTHDVLPPWWNIMEAFPHATLGVLTWPTFGKNTQLDIGNIIEDC